MQVVSSCILYVKTSRPHPHSSFQLYYVTLLDRSLQKNGLQNQTFNLSATVCGQKTTVLKYLAELFTSVDFANCQIK